MTSRNMPSSTRWSARLVWVSVAYSRRAANEIIANSTITPPFPNRKAMHMPPTMIHHALMRALRLTSVDESGFGARHERTPATALAVVRTPMRPRNNRVVSLMAVYRYGAVYREGSGGRG